MIPTKEKPWYWTCEYYQTYGDGDYDYCDHHYFEEAYHRCYSTKEQAERAAERHEQVNPGRTYRWASSYGHDTKVHKADLRHYRTKRKKK